MAHVESSSGQNGDSNGTTTGTNGKSDFVTAHNANSLTNGDSKMPNGCHKRRRKECRVLLCGAGNATHDLIGMLAAKDHADREVVVDVFTMGSFDRFAAGNQAPQNNGIVQVSTFDGRELVGRVNMVSNDASQCVPAADVVLLVLHSLATEPYLRAIQPHLKRGAIVANLSARFGFYLCARQVFGFETGQSATVDILREREVSLCWMLTLPFNGRAVEFGRTATLRGIKDELTVVFPTLDRCIPERASRNADAFRLLHNLLSYPVRGSMKPEFNLSYHTLSSDLSPTIVHIPLIYAFFTEQWDGVSHFKEKPKMYGSMTMFSEQCILGVNQELIALKRALEQRYPGLDLGEDPCIERYMMRVYGSEASDRSSLRGILRTTKPFLESTHPVKEVRSSPDSVQLYTPDFSTRYLTEELPCGLVVLKGMALLLTIATPFIDKMILWGQEKIDEEYLLDGDLVGRDIGKSLCPQRFGCRTADDYMAWMGYTLPIGAA